MSRRRRWFRWLALLLPIMLAGCPLQTSKRKHRTAIDEVDDESGEGDDEGGEGDDEGSDEGDDSGVNVRYKRLPDAVVQTSSTGKPRKSIGKLRRLLCEGREDDKVIFYLLKVSVHWHYFWLCSETRGRRASSRKGAKRVRRWLQGFKQQAESDSGGCKSASDKAVLQGNHESGIQATAHCNGQLVLQFPDGGRGIRTFTSQLGGGAGGGTGDVGSGSSDCACPRCPICPQVGRACPDCPTPQPCPRCPPLKECPACDCSKQTLEAGRKGFGQGVAKACKRICKLVYDKCRQINPNTALCHQVSEYCSVTCTGKKAE